MATEDPRGETFRVGGIEVSIDAKGVVRHGDLSVGRVGREKRFDQWFWRAFDPETGEPAKRFLTSRPEAILLLLINAGYVDGIGF
jgi:hypothetical protein